MGDTSRTLRIVYFVLFVVGTVLPYTQFVPFLAENGLDIPLFAEQAFANHTASGGSLDLLVSTVTLWVLVLVEGRRQGVPHLWAPLVANLAAGVSSGLPLFLFLRASQRDASASGV